MREESIPDVVKDVWAKYWKSIIACALLGAIIAAIWVQVRPSYYSARAELMTGTYALGPQVNSVSAIADAGPLGLELPANSQAQLIDSPATAEHAVKKLGEKGESATQILVESTTASALTDNSFAIDALGTSAEQAVERANAMATGYLALRAEKGRAEFTQLAAQTGLSADAAKDLRALAKKFDGGGQVYRPATTDQVEGPVNSTLVIVLGGVIGAVAGFVLALIRRVFSRRVRTDRDLAQVFGDDLVLTGRNSDVVMLREAARGQLAESGESGPQRITLISPNNPEAEIAAERLVSSRLAGNETDWVLRRGSDVALPGENALEDRDSSLGIPVIVMEKGRDDVIDLINLRNQLRKLGHGTVAVMLVGPESSGQSPVSLGDSLAHSSQNGRVDV